ncbi:unnamed protein product [Phytophthora fragariaefolia]|uniref:Unnamed protein product n=1 Tax=Phytophthora fragariaefolia TaxID=1490495 RepID=A0A9W6YN20_9STRA|nr:unnamed protein product [Phytophthora fragariaefolia]
MGIASGSYARCLSSSLVTVSAFATPPRINTANHFDSAMDDVTARTRFNFTVGELQLLSTKLCLPTPCIVTPERDAVPTVEALAMLCRRLKEPFTLFTVANEFGQSPATYTRICRHVVDLLYSAHKDLLYFNRHVVYRRIERYCEVIKDKGAPLACCWAFVDGTKQYVARPSARRNPAFKFKNLQRDVYNGHPRRHCLNWQAITTPDGIIVSIFGPVEGRRHDSTMLSMSGIWSSSLLTLRESLMGESFTVIQHMDAVNTFTVSLVIPAPTARSKHLMPA